MTRPSYATRLGMTAQKLGSGRVEAASGRVNGAGFSTERMHLNEIKGLMQRMQEARRTLVVAHDYTRRGKDVADMIARAIAELDGSSR